MRHRRRDRGIVLLLALLVLTILIILVGQIVLATAHSKTVADSAMYDLQNSYGTKAGYEIAIHYLLADAEKAPDVDTADEKWSQPQSIQVGKAAVSVRIEDCERRINLAMMVNDKGEPNLKVVARLKRLLRNFGHDETVADRILDYQDSDTKGEYEANARNERLYGLEELQRIDGLKREVLLGDESRKGIIGFLTVWPRTQGQGATFIGAINVNTAGPEVLESLDDELTSTIANAIIARRSTKNADGSSQAFKSVNDLHDVSGMTDKLYQAIQDQVVVRASAFEIHCRSAVNTVEKKWVYAVTRSAGGQQGGAPAAALITSQREPEFLSIKPSEDK